MSTGTLLCLTWASAAATALGVHPLPPLPALMVTLGLLIAYCRSAAADVDMKLQTRYNEHTHPEKSP